MRRRASAVAAGGLLLLPLVLAFSRGGYFDAARLRAAIAACLLLAVAALVADRIVPATTAGRVALAGMAALTGWTALSLLWAPIGGNAIDDVQRLVLYLAALVAAAALLDRRWVEPVLLAEITIVAAYGVSERLLPDLITLTRSVAAGDRLAEPLTYWNAQGALAAIGLVLAAGRGRAWAAAAPLLGLDLYLTLSRGAIGALAAGLLVLLALRPTRATLHSVLLVTVAAAIPALAAELVLTDVMRADSSTRAGAAMLALLVVTGGAAALIPAPREDAQAWLRPVAAVALATALVVTVVAGGGASDRLTSIQSNRYAYWRAAVGAFTERPLHGTGSGGFSTEWLQRREFAESVRDAHSLYLETLAELGLVGALALAALLGGVTACVRRDSAVAAAALATWAVHAGVDWDWEMPALTLVAVLLAGAVIARAAPRA
jgi:O-antigen ligase